MSATELRSGPVTLPLTLHGRIYLLAHDRHRHRLDLERLWLLGFSLRAAMLTDLYLTGKLHDVEGRAHLVGSARHSDPVLSEVLGMIEADEPKTWAGLVAAEQDNAPALVRHQLTGHRWLQLQRYLKLGMFPATRLWLSNEPMVAQLAAGVQTAVADALDGRRADHHLLALGLIGALGEIPTVVRDEDRARHAERLRAVTDEAIPPIAGLRQAIESVYAELGGRPRDGGSGGCGGGGCGGCGGCGG